MSLVNFATPNEPENQHRQLSVKQFGVSQTHSTIRKKALVDVKNTICQRSVQSTHKPTHPTVKPKVKGKNLLLVFNDKENKTVKKNITTQKTTSNHSIHCAEVRDDANRDDFEPVCGCWEKCEDDYADSLLNNIRLSKNQIQKLALVWENPPTVNDEDKRGLDMNLLINPVPDFANYNWHPLVNNVQQVDVMIAQDVPVYEVDMDSIYDSSSEE